MVKDYSKAQDKLIRIIYTLEKELGHMPDLSELCEKTGKKPAQLYIALSNIDFYPKELLLSPSEKKVLEIYRVGLSAKDVSRMTGLLESNTSKILRRLAEKGHIQYIPKKRTPTAKTSLDEKEPVIYIIVVSGELKGARGYLLNRKGSPKANLFLDGVEYTDIPLLISEYEYASGRVG